MTLDVYRRACYDDLGPFLTGFRHESVAEISGSALRLEFGLGNVTELWAPAFDIQKPPEGPPRFSLVFADQVLEHVRDPFAALRTMYALCRPGGWAAVATVFLFPGHDAPGDYFRFSTEALSHLFHSAGFSHITSRGWGSRAAAIKALDWQANNRDFMLSDRLLREGNDPAFHVVTWARGRRPAETPI